MKGLAKVQKGQYLKDGGSCKARVWFVCARMDGCMCLSFSGGQVKQSIG
jgi:hypothetical protein